ncbi:uncharacterized protein LOC105195376 [Solenopsis invicta]|uniref:uncharacterized protein LOC105195376 n=1 Tax=Solenopsis invicta TaxID=13686 RepID=UPI00193D6165|nr:uncharacterized protein LOC105195376 [Solenopsis invicta]XP_039305552.1 uncharacterized protein LOC105195376 [Solenopsis invicta]XP_039305553.1 uncharacterized protein LOC105195376 [Solenopsis invicta]XP_039305555.1 uncharacterized protein LOC105195376 [Solenopsis invicta]
MEEEIHVQVNDNSPSIERTLRPISYTSWLLGVGIAHPRKCPKTITIIIRIIHIIVCTICMIYDAKKFYSYIDSFDMADCVQCLKRAMAYVSAYYYIYHGIRQYNEWPKLMDELKEFDQKIKKEMSMNDQPIKIVEALAIFATIFYMIIPLVYYIIQYVTIYFPSFLPFHDVVLVQSLFNSFVFDVVVYVLYCRYKTMNKLIGQLDKLPDPLAFKIRRIRELHTDIHNLVSKVNDIYSLHLLFCSANSFTMAVASLFQLYYFLDIEATYMFLLLQNFLCIVFVAQFYLTCWTCTLVREESNRTGRIIYEIIFKCKPVLDKHEASNLLSLEVQPPLEDVDSEQSFNRSNSHNVIYIDMKNLLRRYLDRECITKEINDFSLQLQQHRIAFTACNFFEINNNLFRGFVGLFITYLIIVSQLKRQSGEDFRELRKDIMEIKKEISGMFLKGNQTDSQN